MLILLLLSYIIECIYTIDINPQKSFKSFKIIISFYIISFNIVFFKLFIILNALHWLVYVYLFHILLSSLALVIHYYFRDNILAYSSNDNIFINFIKSSPRSVKIIYGDFFQKKIYIYKVIGFILFTSLIFTLAVPTAAVTLYYLILFNLKINKKIETVYVDNIECENISDVFFKCLYNMIHAKAFVIAYMINKKYYIKEIKSYSTYINIFINFLINRFLINQIISEIIFDASQHIYDRVYTDKKPIIYLKNIKNKSKRFKFFLEICIFESAVSIYKH